MPIRAAGPAVLLAALLAAQAFAQEDQNPAWPMLGRSPERTTQSTAGRVSLKPIRWKLDVSPPDGIEWFAESFRERAERGTERPAAVPATYPVVAGSTVYMKIVSMGSDAPLVALDLRTGKLRWRGRPEERESIPPPRGWSRETLLTQDQLAAWRANADHSWNSISCFEERLYVVESGLPGFWNPLLRQAGYEELPTERSGNQLAVYDLNTQGKHLGVIGGRDDARPELAGARFLSGPLVVEGLIVAPAFQGEDCYIYFFREEKKEERPTFELVRRTKLSTRPAPAEEDLPTHHP
ncbi:MAG: hypothetical protein HY720_19305, partial [Planctomycetes bacterium]|nr:hypothetical protein [Planctomycetota bacterium]